MLRAAVKAQSELGLQAKSYMDAGELVPDGLVISMLTERISQDDCRTNGWLLDGFPRTAVQARALDSAGIVPTSVLLLQVPDEVLIERVVGRRLDPETGKIYHVSFNPPTDPDVQARLTQRSDDTEEKALVRLENYYKHSQSIQEHYSALVDSVNGNRGKQDVFDSLVSSIDSAQQSASEDGPDDKTTPPPPASTESDVASSDAASNMDSAKGLSVSEFVRKAEEAFEKGVLDDEDVNWSGQAGVETAASSGVSNYSDLGRRLDLVTGDAAMILLFAYIGRATHVSTSFDFEVVKTAAPFLAAWFLTTPLLGAYTRGATANVGETLKCFVKAWAVAIPMGIGLRGKQCFA